MKRRNFLIGGIGALGNGATGCANIRQVISPNWSNITSAEMGDFLVSLDGGMNRITQDPDRGRFLTELQQRPLAEKDALLFRQGMRSLLLVGNFGDLSVAGQVHPGMQKRLQFSAPEMDASVLGVTDQMKSLSPASRVGIQSALRQDSRLGDRVLEAIDLEAGAVGVPARRRLQLRAMGKHIIGRLKHSPDMFIDEYVTKSQKIASQQGSVAETQRLVAMRMGESAFKARVREAEDASRHWQAMESREIPIGYQPVEGADTREENRVEERSDAWYRGGLSSLGLGAIMTAAGLLLIAIGRPSNDSEGNDAALVVGVVLGITVGPLTILLGLITLLLAGLIDLTDGP